MSTQWDIVIESEKTERHYWRDLWTYRELFAFLAWRDILVRYKQTVIGLAWSVMRPLLTMLVFTVIFGKLAKLPSDGSPYPILVFAAMLPWQFFANSFTEASNSLIANANLLTKVYFPRLIIPASSVIVGLVDFLISFALLIALMAWYEYVPSWRILFMPLFLLLVFLISFGSGLFVAALNVKYRDFRYIVPFIVQFGLYISPVGFRSSIIPPEWRLVYSLNPMVGAIDGFRWCILDDSSPLDVASISISLFVSLALMIIGISFFRRTERGFADTI
jgi:lipopolysaccharide transport system permease protein